jgi:hypothetical protein
MVSTPAGERDAKMARSREVKPELGWWWGREKGGLAYRTAGMPVTADDRKRITRWFSAASLKST